LLERLETDFNQMIKELYKAVTKKKHYKKKVRHLKHQATSAASLEKELNQRTITVLEQSILE
jgi:DNA-directed RNA polymerase specialized sigma54-like protein